ncbi:MAG TPA: DNA polymerase III subunit delta [Pararhizobium sp.]|nr:DNA polymerase III subunit delta [Pararhizobium sp.]
MAEIKAHEFDRFIASGKSGYRLFLLYGPDRGLVSERAASLAERSGVDLKDPFSLVRLDNDSLKGDPGRLADEANAVALFGGRRLIWLRGAGNDRGLTAVVADLASAADGTTTVIVEAGELKKGTALRKAVEAAPAGLAIPCYADERRSLQALIDEELGREELRITPAARTRLTELLGGDRLASRSELRKLVLYCHGTGRVSEEDVIASVGDAAAASADEAVDAVLSGDLAGLDHALQRITASKTAVFTIILACLRQFQMLDSMRAEMAATGRTAGQVMATTGRRIHFRRKPAVESALQKWNARQIAQVLGHFQRTVLEMRRRPQLEDDIARQALLAAGVRSARSKA